MSSSESVSIKVKEGLGLLDGDYLGRYVAGARPSAIVPVEQDSAFLSIMEGFAGRNIIRHLVTAGYPREWGL